MPTPDIRIAAHFAALPDPRVTRTRRHRLDDILVVALCAVICGADTFEQSETFAAAREPWLKTFLALRNGVPSHDTFNRVLAALDHRAFAACFAGWMAEVCQAHGLQAIAVDGKACRGTPGETFSGCLHVVTAWAVENRVFLGQVAVADGSHEIAAIPALLKLLHLKGAVVTIDAAGCRKDSGAQVRAQGGDYVVAVKGNQPALQKAVREAFDRAAEGACSACPMTSSVGDAHGRHEGRYVTVLKNPTGLPPAWVGVGSVVMVGRERGVGGVNTTSVHYDLTSLRATAKTLAGYIRGHWGVENGLHWCLDVSFREDENRTRDTNAGADLGAVRRTAASLLQQDPGNGSIRTKRLNAALDPNCLKCVLQGFPAK